MLPGARAQHRVEAALRERAGDNLGERREDRVLELRHDEPDHARLPPPQMRRPLVADHVERGQHRRARRVRDAGLAVQHAADRRLADAGLLRDVCKLAGHAATLRQNPANTCKISQQEAQLCGGGRCWPPRPPDPLTVLGRLRGLAGDQQHAGNRHGQSNACEDADRTVGTVERSGG